MISSPIGGAPILSPHASGSESLLSIQTPDSSGASVTGTRIRKGMYKVLDTKVELPLISKNKVKLSQQVHLENLSPTQLGLQNFWIQTIDDLKPPTPEAPVFDDDEEPISNQLDALGVDIAPFPSEADVQSFAHSQSEVKDIFARRKLRTPPDQRQRIWNERAARKALLDAQRQAELDEYNSFAVVSHSRLGIPQTPGTGLDDDDAAAEHTADLPVTSPQQRHFELSEATKAQLLSHERAAVRGKITAVDERTVHDIQQRIAQRKVAEQRQKEKAELEARRRKVLFDDHSQKTLEEAQAASQAATQALRRRTIASQLKEQGKKQVTGMFDKSIPPLQSEHVPDVVIDAMALNEFKTESGQISRVTSAGQETRETKDGLRLKRKTANGTSRENSRPGTTQIEGQLGEHEKPSGDISNGLTRAMENLKSMSLNDAKMREQWGKYIGPQAKASFTAIIQHASRDLRVAPKDKDVPEECRTPRHAYLREVTKANLLPLPTILRKAAHPKGVFLAHKGLGDARMLPIVAVIDQLPAVECVDLCDNRLTDISLMPLMSKLVNMSTLLYLDLSFNDMDDSSMTIQAFIRAPNCALHTLLINGSDVDDYECVHLCEALIENKSIMTLGLASNLIGNDEHMKVTDPTRVLGGDGLALMLTKNTTLTSLDLQYNLLRQTGAMAIGKALRDNKCLKVLKVAYNSFGDIGTQWLGHSLKFNTTLERIDLTSNSVVPKSACVIANALAHNTSLKELILDDNILGRVGAQAVASAIQRSSQSSREDKLIISFKSCDCFKATPSLFDPSTPGGKWTLDLGEPYGAMIIEECFFLANYRAGCQINALKYNKTDVLLERKVEKDQAEGFNLERFVAASKSAATSTINGEFRAAAKDLQVVLNEFRFIMSNEKRKKVCELVQKSWQRKGKSQERTEDLHEVFLIEVFSALFRLNDVNNDETMDVEEFLETLSSLGYANFDRNAALTLMAEHDRDMSGTIDGSEFAMIMVKEFCRIDLPRGVMVDSITKKPWVLPPEGTAIIDVGFEIDAPSSCDVGSDEGIMTLIKGIQSAKTGEQKDILFAQACRSPYFFLTSEQAQMLFDDAQSAGLSKHPIDMIIAILPQIVNEEQVNRFLDHNLNESGKLSLRVRMGPLYNAFVGLPTGHYFINFEKVLDTLGAKRLAALSVSESKAMRVIGANTSQKGNGSNFRNEMKGTWGKQEPIAVDGQWFAHPPEHGELRFDYVSTRRPLVGTLPLSAHRLQRLVKRLELHTIIPLMAKVKELKAQGKSPKKRTSPLTLPTLRNKPSQEKIDNAALLASTPMDVNDVDDESAAHEDSVDADDNVDEAFQRIKPQAPVTRGLVKEQFYEYIASCHHHTDILPEEQMRDVSRMNYNPDPDFRPPTPDVLASGEVPGKRNMPDIYPYAYRKLLELQIMMPTIFISTSQAMELIYYFPSEGYLRIQFLQSVFSHIVDIENLHIIYDCVLNADERAELMHRIGIMNTFDTMSPDREYILDLRRWDMREFCKILIQLSVNEPGDNWVAGGEYRWSKYDDPVPGWVLPQPWTTKDEFDDPTIRTKDAGPRRYGWLRCTYTSAGPGCEPNMLARRQLRRKMLSGLKQLL